jgi:hypothetical protein
MSLKVEVRITPHPDKVPAEEFDRLLDGELVEFEKWFIERQRRAGNTKPSGLVSVERAAVKTYVLYLSTLERLDN